MLQKLLQNLRKEEKVPKHLCDCIIQILNETRQMRSKIINLSFINIYVNILEY